MKRTILAICFMALIMGPKAYAEEQQVQVTADSEQAAKQQELSEIVVTATRTKQIAKEAPTKVEVVKSEQITSSANTTPEQSLKELPGVTSTREPGPTGITAKGAHSSGIALRGFASGQTMVLVDGLPLNNYELNAQWWSIPSTTIDRIEVVKGPFSSLYGGWGLGGVVNVITKTDWAPLTFSQTVGSYNYNEVAVSSGFSIKDFTFHIAFDNKTVGEVRETNYIADDSRSYSSTATYGQSCEKADGTGLAYEDGYTSYSTEIQDIEFGVNWDITTDSYLGFKVSNATFDQTPEEALDFDDDDISSSQFIRKHGTRTYNVNYYNNMLENVEILTNFGVVYNYLDSYRSNSSDTSSVQYGESLRPNARYSLGTQANITLPYANTLTVGLDASKYRINSDDYYMTRTSISYYPQLAKGTMYAGGLYLQDEWKANNYLILYAGLRYDYFKAFDAEIGIDQNGTLDMDDIDDKSKGYLSPKLSVVIMPDDETTIRATAGDTFRSPAIWDLYSSTYYPLTSDRSRKIANPDLDPETARSYELGIERSFFNRVVLGATYFNNHIEDMIYKVEINADGDTQNQNIAEAYTKGYELSLSCKVFEGVVLYANQTHTNTKITKDDREFGLSDSLEGKEFKEVPEDVFKYGCDLKYRGLFANVQGQSVSDQYYEEDNSDIYDHGYGGYDRYTIVDATLGYQFLGNCSVSVSVFNIGDREYWKGTSRSTGRTFMAKATLSF